MVLYMKPVFPLVYVWPNGGWVEMAAHHRECTYSCELLHCPKRGSVIAAENSARRLMGKPSCWTNSLSRVPWEQRFRLLNPQERKLQEAGDKGPASQPCSSLFTCVCIFSANVPGSAAFSYMSSLKPFF